MEKEIVFVVDTSRSMGVNFVDYLRSFIGDIYCKYEEVSKRVICFNEEYEIFDGDDLGDFKIGGKTSLDKGLEGLYDCLSNSDDKERVIFFISDFISDDYSETENLKKLKGLKAFNDSCRYGICLGTDYDVINRYLSRFVNDIENIVSVYSSFYLRDFIESILDEFVFGFNS